MRKKVCIVVSHPIQYYSPWFRHIAEQSHLDLMVFYLWDFGVVEKEDHKFKTSFSWDIPLLDGYPNRLLKNVSEDPGTHHFKGLDNPDLIPELKAEKPDAILLFGYNYASHSRVIRDATLRSVPLIFRGDSHTLVPTSGVKPIIGRVLRIFLFRRFQAFLSVGTANEAYFRECLVPQKKLFRAHHCVDNARFQSDYASVKLSASAWRDQLGIPTDAFVFLFVGKFEEKKRPLDLLRAFQDAALPRAVLLFVGGGTLEEQLRAEAGQNVHFAPFQNQSQMPRTYAVGDCLVLPSYGRSETWGLVVNEAMNLKLPVIVSSHVGCGADLVIEGETGWSFPAGDRGELTARLATVAQDPAQSARMGRAAFDLISTFSYEQATQALEQAVAR